MAYDWYWYDKDSFEKGMDIGMHIYYERKRIISFAVIFICTLGVILGLNHLWFAKCDEERQLIFTENTYGMVIYEGETIEQTFQSEDGYLESVLVLTAQGSENDKITVTLFDQEHHELASRYMTMDSSVGMLKADFRKKLHPGTFYHISILFEDINNGYSIYFVPTEDLPKSYGHCTLNEEVMDAALFVWFDYSIFRWDLFLVFLVPVFILGIFFLFDFSNNMISRIADGIGTVCCTLLCINSVNYLGTSASQVDNIFMLERAWIITVLLVLILIALFTVIVRRLNVGIIIALSVCYLYGLISHFVILFRGTPFLPVDIFAISTAKAVASNYIYTLDDALIFACISYVIIVLFCISTRTKISMGMFKRVAVAISLLALCFCSGTSWFTQAVGLTPYYYSQEEGIKRYGSIFNFITNIQSCFTKKPEGYSIERIREIANCFEDDECNIRGELPNLIVIMNESWADINIVNEPDKASSYMPNITRFSEAGDCFLGNVVVPTFGGGTNKSEFAFLTGSVMSFGLTGSCYDLDCQEGTASMVSALKDLGYYTIALHPAYYKNWDRDIGYKKLGFDQFYSIEDLSSYEMEYLRSYGYVSDSSLYNVIYDLTDNAAEDKPIFIFCVTIQNHGDYNDESYTPTIAAEDSQTAQYLSLVKETDAAFAQLVEHYRLSQTATAVLMFGDHMPSLDNIEQFVPSGSLEYFTTPYVIWSNFDDEYEFEIPYCTINYLQPYFFEAAGLPLTGYQKFLKENSLKYPLIHGGKYYDNDKTPHVITQGNLPEEIINYQYIQYNNLFDSANRVTQFYSK